MAILLLDYDGVIADSLSLESEYFVPICRKRGIKAISAQNDLVELCKDKNLCVRLEETGVPVEVYLDAYNEYQREAERVGAKALPFPGMIELLREIINRIPVYIVTSNIYKFPEEMFHRFGIEGIKGIYSLDMNLDKTEKINLIMKLHPGEKFYFVTDSTGDVAEARAANVDVIIAVSWGWLDRKSLEESKPDFLFDEVFELDRFIKNEIL